jgi:hypothetical protein
MEGDGEPEARRWEIDEGESSMSPDSLNRQSAVRLRGKACHVTPPPSP